MYIFIHAHFDSASIKTGEVQRKLARFLSTDDLETHEARIFLGSSLLCWKRVCT